MPELTKRWRDLKISPSFFLQALLIVTAFVVILNFQKDFSRSSVSKDHLMLSSGVISHTVLGFRLLACDLIWIRFLQEVDYKESSHVSEGWAFHMVDAITILDPRFWFAYRLGSIVLGVLVHDVKGAAIIFNRGVEHFPKDWNLQYQAGYHFLAEVKDCKRAADLFREAAANGAPSWVNSLASRLYMKSGQYGLAKSILINAIRTLPDSTYKKELKLRLKQLEESYLDPKNDTLIKGLNCK